MELVKYKELEDIQNEIKQTNKLMTMDFVESINRQKKIIEIQREVWYPQILQQTVLRIFALSGCSNKIDELVQSDISEMLKTRFKTFSLSELMYAFKLERYGAYELRTEHFNHFDAVYISKVLGKYQKWKSEMVKKLKPKAPKLMIEQKLPPKKQLVENEYKEFLKSGKVHQLAPRLIWEYLEKNNIINPSNEERWEVYNRELTRYKSELKNPSNNKEKNAFNEILGKINKGAKIDEVKRRCKRIFIEKFFNEVKEMGIEITEILK